MVRFFPIADWAPAQEAIYDDPNRQVSLPTNPDNFYRIEDDDEPEAGPSSPSSSRRAVPHHEPRFRSLSMSLHWRPRPKSSGFGPDDLISRLPELAIADTHSSAAEAHHSCEGHEVAAEPANGSGKGKNPLKSMIHRASVSLKHLVPRRTSIATSTGEDHHDHHTHRHFLRSAHGSSHHGGSSSQNQPHQLFSRVHRESSDEIRPTTSHSTWRRLRQAASFRHSRGAFLDTIESPRGSLHFAAPIPGSANAPPIIPRNTGGAARAAAADAAFHADALRWLSPAEWATSMAGPGGLLSHHHNLNHSNNDGESGIGIAVTATESDSDREKADSRLELVHPDSSLELAVDHKLVVHETSQAEENGGIPRVDFVGRLPVELAIQILAHLDHADIANAARVSRAWNYVTTNQHIWRESFLRGMTTTYATSGSVKPGTGMGVPPVSPNNNWNEIYRAKVELDRRWRAGTVTPVYLNGHSDSIYCLQFDETKIVTGSRDKTIRIWDMHTLSCRLVIGPPEVTRQPDLLDQDGQPTHFATTTDEPRTRASSPLAISYPIHHNASILCLQYDDQILVTGSSDSTCIVYTMSAGGRPVPTRRLQHHTYAVLDLIFDDKHIVSCSKDHTVCVWDRETGALLRHLRGHTGPVNAVQMRGNTVVSCSGDFKVKLWNISTGKCIREFIGHTKGLACSQFSEDGRYVASAGNDRTIRVWDANTGECVREMKAHENLVRSLHIDSVSGRLVSGSYDTDIMVFDMETGRQLLHFEKWHASWVLSAKSDYRRIISTGQDPKILVLDFGKGVEGIELLESCRPGGAAGLSLHGSPVAVGDGEDWV